MAEEARFNVARMGIGCSFREIFRAWLEYDWVEELQAYGVRGVFALQVGGWGSGVFGR